MKLSCISFLYSSAFGCCYSLRSCFKPSACRCFASLYSLVQCFVKVCVGVPRELLSFQSNLSISAFGCYSLRSCFNPAIRWLVDASHLSSLVCVVQCFVNVPCVISHRIASLVCMCIHLSADSGEETPLGGFSPSGAFLISYANYKYPRTHYICRAFNFCL